MPDGIQQSARGLDLSPRVVQSVTVAGSPALAAETTICTVTIPANLAIASAVILLGYCSVTIGTSGVSARLRIRQTSTAGAVVADTGATTGGVAATNVCDLNVNGADAAPVGAQVYVLTLTIGSGAAVSTVGFASLVAIAV